MEQMNAALVAAVCNRHKEDGRLRPSKFDGTSASHLLRPLPWSLRIKGWRRLADNVGPRCVLERIVVGRQMHLNQKPDRYRQQEGQELCEPIVGQVQSHE